MDLEWDRGLAAPARVSHHGFVEVLLSSSASSAAFPDTFTAGVMVDPSSSLVVPSSNLSTIFTATGYLATSEATNVKIFPFVYITHDTYARVLNKLNELEQKTNSEIKFNFRDQNKIIDTNDYIRGTLPPLDRDTRKENIEKSTSLFSSLKHGEKEDVDVETSKNVAESSSEEEEDDDDDYDSDFSEDSFERSLPTANRRKEKLRDKAERKDAKSGLLKKKKNEFLEKFVLAKNIKNPDDVLFGPPMLQMGAADYLVVVGQQTDTECTLNGREVHIFGPTAAAVSEAKIRLMAIQTLYKRCRREPTAVPCLHLNGDKGEYGVYFCPLDQYSKQDSVATFDRQVPSWVLVPVFKTAGGKYIKPSDVVSNENLADQMNELSARFNRVSPTQTPSQSISRDASPSPSASAWGPAPSVAPAWGPSSPALEQYNLPERTSTPPGQAPLWGENRYTMKVGSAETGRKTSQGNKRNNGPSHSGSRWGPSSSAAKEDPTDFPALPIRPTKETQKHHGRQQRRVVTIRPQKAPPQRATDSTVGNLTIARDYNLNNMKETLREGLNSMRTFRGEIKLSAKLGKFLWRDLPEAIQKKVWGFFDVKDILMGEHKVKPSFNNMAFISEDMLKAIKKCLPSKPSARSLFYEIHNNFRTKGSEPWRQATMYVAATSAKMYKLHLLQQSIAEVDWISLDRKFDFQLQLKASEIGRAETKPFMSFTRRMALRPNPDGVQGSQLVFEETQGLIKVNRILYKEACTYNLGNGFELHMIRVEEVPRTKDYESSSSIKYTAQSGRGRVWYEVEVTFQPFHDIFKHNMEKEEVGTPESWNAEDVFGKNDSHLQRFVLTMIRTINQFEGAEKR
ncbi:hypothetical protein BX666DRAFT_2029027 [Dichotomocladium elegans]|nr:hypothetical protein BX666DRAFT_2029027 [Dichotomocladium elegans]